MQGMPAVLMGAAVQQHSSCAPCIPSINLPTGGCMCRAPRAWRPRAPATGRGSNAASNYLLQHRLQQPYAACQDTHAPRITGRRRRGRACDNRVRGSYAGPCLRPQSPHLQICITIKSRFPRRFWVTAPFGHAWERGTALVHTRNLLPPACRTRCMCLSSPHTPAYIACLSHP